MEISQARSSFVCLLLLLSIFFIPCVFSKSPRPISVSFAYISVSSVGICFTDFTGEIDFVGCGDQAEEERMLR